jgi:trans-aconitate 2-methyltransferase
LGVLAAQARSCSSGRQQARVLKSFGMQVPVGSNPTPSAPLPPHSVRRSGHAVRLEEESTAPLIISPMSTVWDPTQYLRFEEERARPFKDLISRIPNQVATEIVDLGCGPGNMTAVLSDRWPNAQVLGIDSSREMVERASELTRPGRLTFVKQDLREWQPEQPVDVLVTNATLQWVAGHVELFPAFVSALAPGGTFAFQVPRGSGGPSRGLLDELAQSHRWKDILSPVLAAWPKTLEPTDYLRAILATGARADVWETTYLHVLRGPDAVLQWMAGTDLRPIKAALETKGGELLADEFIGEYSALLRASYPCDSEKRVVLPFSRIFGVASI